MSGEKLGKIQDVRFGFGGYQDAMIGISFTLGGDGWGVGDFWGDWSIKRSDTAKWSEADRMGRLAETVWRIKELLDDAKVRNVEDLKDIPVMVSFEGNTLKSWRVLKEVL